MDQTKNHGVMKNVQLKHRVTRNFGPDNVTKKQKLSDTSE